MASVELKSAAELGYMRDAGRIVRDILVELRKAVRPGVSTLELDQLAEDLTYKNGAKPAFKGYRGFPCALCASVNDEVVHGIPSKKRVLKEGDLMKLDFGVVCRGYYGDSAVTVPVGKVSAASARLIDTTRESLEAGIAAVKDGNRISDIGAAVQKHVEAAGYSVVRDFVGHGIGRALHEEPKIPNYDFTRGVGQLQNPRLRPGMVLAIEPMVNVGGPGVKTLSDDWTAVTLDHSLSAHFEHTVALTEQGVEVLTG
ncbi:MAG: type I methionyl aminopeptidase [Deltaproteobacteria bacterium]|nr:type I methionyl aminopeptidase [Deltaproteobacteria bacterium]